MAGKERGPLKERKKFNGENMLAQKGLGIIMIKKNNKGGEIKDYINVGKTNKSMIDREAFEKWVVEQGHIQ